MELVGGAEHRGLQLGPSLRIVTFLHPGDLLVGYSHLPGQGGVLAKLVLGAAVPAGAEDCELADAGRELTIDHHAGGEGRPCAQELGMPCQRVEGVVVGARTDAVDEDFRLRIAVLPRERADTCGRRPDDIYCHVISLIWVNPVANGRRAPAAGEGPSRASASESAFRASCARAIRHGRWFLPMVGGSIAPPLAVRG